MHGATVVLAPLLLFVVLLAGSSVTAANCPGQLLYDIKLNESAFWPNLMNSGYVALETGVFVETNLVWFLFNNPFSLAVFDPDDFANTPLVSTAAFQNRNPNTGLAHFPGLDSAQNILVDETRDQIILTVDTFPNATGIFFLRRSTFLNSGNSGLPSGIQFVRPPIPMGPSPRGLVFDPANDGSFYASALNNISKFDASGNLIFSTQTANLPTGVYHWAMTIDAESNLLWATSYSDSVFYAYTISGNSLTLNQELVLGEESRGIAYDPNMRELYAVKRPSGFVRVKPYNSGFSITPFGGTFWRPNALAIDTSRNWVYIADTEDQSSAISDRIRVFHYQHTGCQCRDDTDCDGTDTCHIGICVTTPCLTCEVGLPDGSCTSSSCVSTSNTDPILYPVQLNFSSASPQFGLIPQGDISKELFVLFETLDEILPIGGLPRQSVNLLTQTYFLNGPFDTGSSQDFNITTTTDNPQLTWYYSLLASNVTAQHPFGSATLNQNGQETKWTFRVEDWPWLSNNNSLNLRLRLWSNDGAFISNSSQTNPDGTTSFILNTQNSVITVTMINFAIVDGSTQVPVDIEYLTSNSVLVINFPYFTTSVTYDPNFGVLVTPKDDGDGTDEVLVIVLSVVIPVVVVPVLLIIAVLIAMYVVYYFRRRTLAHARDTINTDSFEYAAAAVDVEDN